MNLTLFGYMMNLFIFRLSTTDLQSIYDFYYYYFRFCFSFQAYRQALAWSPHQNFSLGRPTSPEGAAGSRSGSCALSQALPRCPSDLSVCPVPLAIHQPLPLSPGPSHRLSPAHTHTLEYSLLPSLFTYVLLSLQVSAQTSLPQRPLPALSK